MAEDGKGTKALVVDGTTGETGEVMEVRWRFDPAGLLVVEGKRRLAISWDAIAVPLPIAKVMLAQTLMFEASLSGRGVGEETKERTTRGRVM